MDDDSASIRWGVLLALLVAAFMIEPLFGASVAVEVIALVLFELVVIGAVFLSADGLRLRLVGGGLTAIWFFVSMAALWGMEMSGGVAYLSFALVLGALAVTLRILLRRGQGDGETLLGAIFGYLLLAMTWAMLFVQIERWQPGSFSVPEGSDVLSSMLYFSLVTLTTLGYGDILPVSSLARMAAGFEAVIGVLYIAVMVGSIVGLIQSRRRG